MHAFLKQVEHLAPCRHPLLLLGQQGTGKTYLARQVHAMSGHSGPLVEHSAALPRGLEIAELLGHVKGAFTGAVQDRMGLVEAAHGGTFFLDEIAEAHSSALAKQRENQ